MTRDSQPAIPDQPQRHLGHCTSSELDGYEAELQGVLRSCMDEATRTLVFAKLSHVTAEREARHRIGHRCAWPIH